MLAVRNEERHLERALAAVCAQDWPAGQLEVLIVDGSSTDRTREIAALAASRDPRIQVLHNPARIVACGLNLGLAAARGEVIVRVDGHCGVPRSYVRSGVACLRSGLAECAGGPVRAVGDTLVARAIAIAMSTPFGVGGASFRWAREEREVDHLPFGVWRREVFDSLGGYDETLVRNQDDEFSDRLRRAGGRIRLLPAELVEYWSRTSLAGLGRQYFGYGYWKIRVIAKRGGVPSSWRHVVPAALILATAGGALCAAVLGSPWPATVVPAAYAAFLALATAATLHTHRRAEALLLPVVLPAMQLAYGGGFLAALAARAIAPPTAPVTPVVAEPSDARAA